MKSLDLADMGNLAFHKLSILTRSQDAGGERGIRTLDRAFDPITV